MTDGPISRKHIVGGHDQADRQRDGEDHGLAGVQNRERGICFNARLFVKRHRLVVAFGLAIFRSKVFDGFVVEQAVDGLRVGVRVAFVHRAADGEPPVGRTDREPQVADDHRDDGRNVAPVEFDGADDDDHEKFDDRRDEGHQRHTADVFNARPAALQNARQPARLAFEMKAHRQPVHMLERRQRQFPDGMHGNAREHALADLNQQRHHDARQPIENARQYRRTDEPRHRLARGHMAARRGDQRVRRPFQGEGHADCDQLGNDDEKQRPDHCPLQVRPVVWPDVRPKSPQDPAAFGGRFETRQKAAARGGRRVR